MRKHILLLLVLTIFSKLSFACTIFTCTLKGEVLAGANEDHDNPFTKVWFSPSTKDRYGMVCFGFPDLQAQAAINEYGLFYDVTAQGIDPSVHNLKNPYYGHVMLEVLAKCKNVKEALEFLRTHDYYSSSQATLADAEGRAIVINSGVLIEKNGKHQVNTNFNVSRLATKNYSCGRYDIADEMLLKATSISVPLFRKILSLTHQEGEYPTQYSQVFDLKRGLIYVYLYHNYENVYVIDLKKELKKGYRVENLVDHFTPSFAYKEFAKKHEEYSREVMLKEIKEKGFDKALAHYESLKKSGASKDSIKIIYYDVAMVMLKAAYNKHSNGNWLSYWFKFPNSYFVWQSKEEHITNALKLLNILLKEGSFANRKFSPWFFEFYAYTNMVAGNKDVAKEYFEKAISIASKESDPFIRSSNMLQKIRP